MIPRGVNASRRKTPPRSATTSGLTMADTDRNDRRSINGAFDMGITHRKNRRIFSFVKAVSVACSLRRRRSRDCTRDGWTDFVPKRALDRAPPCTTQSALPTIGPSVCQIDQGAATEIMLGRAGPHSPRTGSSHHPPAFVCTLPRRRRGRAFLLVQGPES
jgi:hypothetical protein